MIRTDLALEAKALWERSAEKTTKLEGVRAVERGNVTWVDILDDRGAKALGKPVGSYLTLELPSYDRDPREPAETLAQELRALMKLEEGQSVMVVGLVMNRRALKDEIKLKKQYIRETDERAWQIAYRSGHTSYWFDAFGLLLAAIIGGYFSPVVAVTCICCLLYICLVRLGLKLYYSAKI